MRQHWGRLSILALIIALATPLLSTQAQETELGVEIDPQSGPPGTIVTISGQGAPPGETIQVLTSLWDDPIECRIGRGASLITEVTADDNGNFSATHTTEQVSADQVGYTYLAQLPVREAPQPMSNLQCFAFAETSESRFFDATGYWMTARLLEFRENNGGLPMFGYPISGVLAEDGRSVQYTERQRFEYHDELQEPYDILLGLLGYDAAAQRGLLDTEPFQPLPESTQSDDICMFFPETGHRLCHGFLTYWQNNGLDFGDDGTSFRESLALFGYPISEEFTDPDSGLTTQYFERARFEYHPDNEPPHEILLGRLGAEVWEGSESVIRSVNIYLVALEDAGQSGMEIGCNDSLIPVEVQISTSDNTESKITAALNEMFAIDEEFYGESGLYNVFHRSDLTVESVSVSADGTATINLAGSFLIGGVCDEPRVEGQIEQTALQFDGANDVVILLDNEPIFPPPQS